MRVDNDILVDAQRTQTRKDPKRKSNERSRRTKEKRKREDSKEDKLQPRNTVFQKDFQRTKIQKQQIPNDEKFPEMSNAVFLIREQIMENLDDEIEQRCYGIRTNEKLGLTVNPHPIIEEDIIDCNGDIEDDFESSLDDHERLNVILEPQGKVCRVHMEQEVWRTFRQHTREEISSGSVDGPAGECSSPVRSTNCMCRVRK